MPQKTGRPPFQWNDALEEFIISCVIGGMSLRQIVQTGRQEFKTFPSDMSIKNHLAASSEFMSKYAIAKELAQDLMAEDIVDIIDGRFPGFENEELDQRKASAEIRKWVMGKLRRKKWGEIKTTEVTGADGTPLVQPQILDTRNMPPEAQMALYDALQIVMAQQNAEDGQFTEEETTNGD